MGEDFLLERDRRFDAANHELAERAFHAGNGNFSGGTGDDELGDHRIVIRRNRVAGVNMGIDADALAARCIPEIDGAGARGEVIVGIFRVDTALDGMPARTCLEHMAGQRLAGSNPDLLLNELAAHHFFRHRVLNLDPGIHLHEIEILSLLVDKILDGAGVLIVDRLDQRYRCLAHALAEFRREEWRRTFLNDLLVSTLHRAIPLAQVDVVAVGIRDDLKLDMVRIDDKLFEVALAVSERRERFIGRSAK